MRTAPPRCCEKQKRQGRDLLQDGDQLWVSLRSLLILLVQLGESLTGCRQVILQPLHLLPGARICSRQPIQSQDDRQMTKRKKEEECSEEQLPRKYTHSLTCMTTAGAPASSARCSRVHVGCLYRDLAAIGARNLSNNTRQTGKTRRVRRFFFL